MKVGIVGLGLIGGSFARAYSATGHEVYARETNPAAMEMALAEQAVMAPLTKENAGECDVILVCVYPQAAVDFLADFGPAFGAHPLVIDCCGVKRNVTEAGMALGKKFGFTFLGGHPMAGTQFSGFENSRWNMFHGAPMVIVPPEGADENLLKRVKWVLSPAVFGTITITTAEEHDRIIAFTSQLAHVVSNAYVKSPAAQVHKGFSAGSYKDLTRVAWLNPEMWAELFLDNRENLIQEIDTLIDNLRQYRDDLAVEDREGLIRLLQAGKERKEELDG
ncbi:MAG: prephenate dehydrogenase [Clostridia bacterium]|nr:prephenate dehydrogenase [Clostridia bacterium]